MPPPIHAFVSMAQFFFPDPCFYSPAQPVRDFALSYLMGKPWSLVPSLLPPSTCLHFHRTYGSAFTLFMLVDCHRVLPIQVLALSAIKSTFTQELKFLRAREDSNPHG